jgi:hypothetical protein
MTSCFRLSFPKATARCMAFVSCLLTLWAALDSQVVAAATPQNANHTDARQPAPQDDDDDMVKPEPSPKASPVASCNAEGAAFLHPRTPVPLIDRAVPALSRTFAPPIPDQRNGIGTLLRC